MPPLHIAVHGEKRRPGSEGADLPPAPPPGFFSTLFLLRSLWNKSPFPIVLPLIRLLPSSEIVTAAAITMGWGVMAGTEKAAYPGGATLKPPHV